MKAVYRRHRPQLIAALQRYPALGTGWHNLLRMAEALGEASITGVVAGTDWSLVSPVDAAMVPYQDLAACVLAEARATGAWPQAKAALQELWTRLAQPKLTQFAKADLGPPGADPGESRRLALAEREDLWDHLLAPLLEAMVRSGGEGEVPGLLMGLDQSWDALGPRLRAEARALGRPGLAPAWVAATRALSPRLPREGLIGQDLVLIYLGQPPGAHDAFTLGFLKEGLALQPQPATAAWVRRLGWEGAGPRWALVDGGGEVLLKGERLPGAPALLTTFRALGRSTAMARVQTLLKAHPGHLGGLAIRARLLDGIAWAHWNERHGQERPVPDMGEAEAGAWRGLLGDLDRMLDDPLALSPYPLMRAGLHVPQRGWWSGDLEGAAEALARRALPLVEAALARRPSDLELWRMWLTWAPWQERELLPLLEGLEPSPLAAPGAFPPRAVLIEATRCLAAQERWGRVVELLQHRTNRSPGLTLSLLEALLHLGRTLEVDAILADLDRVGAPLAAHDLTALCRLGETLGETAWVRRWTPVRPGAASGR